MKRSFRKNVKPHKKEFARKLRNNPTNSEKIMWEELRGKKLGVKFRRQVVILGWIVDFYCPAKKLVVELDGRFHRRPGQPEIDAYRDRKMREDGYFILRIDSSRVFTDTITVIAQVQLALDGYISE